MVQSWLTHGQVLDLLMAHLDLADQARLSAVDKGLCDALRTDWAARPRVQQTKQYLSAIHFGTTRKQVRLDLESTAASGRPLYLLPKWPTTGGHDGLSVQLLGELLPDAHKVVAVAHGALHLCRRGQSPAVHLYELDSWTVQLLQEVLLNGLGRTLDTLMLTFANFDLARASGLAGALAAMVLPGLTRLHLNGSLPPGGTKLLLTAAMKLPNLCNLTLDGRLLQTGALKQVKFPCLDLLHVFNVTTGVPAAIAEAAALSAFPQLKTLMVIGAVGDDGCEHLARVLKYLPNLDMLNLQNSQIGPAGALTLLRELPVRTILILRSNRALENTPELNLLRVQLGDRLRF